MNIETLNIRLCKVETSEQKKNLLEVFINIFAESWTKENFYNLINKINVESFLFYNKKNKITGLCIILNLTPEIEIIKFGIKSSYRNNEFGCIFLKSIIYYYSIRNIENIFLEVSSENNSAIRLYKKLGFKKINIRRNYYKKSKESYEDAIIMQKKISFF